VVAGRGEILTMSPATVQRILAALVLKPHRLRYFLTRTDPLFEEKMAEILDLSLPPPRHCRVLCLDEKTHIQALERLYPPCRWVRAWSNGRSLSICGMGPLISSPPLTSVRGKSSRSAKQLGKSNAVF
jgi:hypothetical protein